MSNDWQQPVTIRPIGVVVSDLKNFDQIPTYREESCLSIREDLPVSGGGDLQVCRIRLGRHEEILVPARDEEREKGEDEGAPGLTVGHSHQIYHPGG